MDIQEHFYIEKRKTLQLFHIVHKGGCPLLPHTSRRSFLGKFSNFKEMLEVIDPINEVQKCQRCFDEENII